MKLIYSYINKFRNIYKQEILFSSDYDVKFDGSKINITYKGPSEAKRLLFPHTNMQNLCVLLGKTGSGKTNILQLVGMTLELRASEAADSAYFLLYADEREESGRKYVIEIVNMKLEGINADREVKKVQGVHEKIAEYVELLDRIQLFKFGCDPIQGIYGAEEIFYGDTDETLIIDGFDRYAFANCPYSEVRVRQHDDTDRWLMRYVAPYQRTEVGCICKYIYDYIKEFEENSIKQRASLVIRWDNWLNEILYPLDEKLEKSDYWTFAGRKKQMLEDVFQGRNLKKHRESKVSIKQQFVHDLWTDFAIYLRKWIAYTEMFVSKEILEEDLDCSGTKDIYQEYIDYAYEKEYGDKVDPTTLPDFEKMSIVKRIFWLAQYIDRKVNRNPRGVLWQLADDMKEIGNELLKLDDKYFTEEGFVIPVKDIYAEDNYEHMQVIFECMEQYVPDDIGLFEKELLPYEFSCLSSGELQYAKVFGAIEEYCILMKMNKKEPDIIYLLDEPEVYMHPELCRQFIKRVEDTLTKKNANVNIQLIISTHSPFLLSDVLPEQIVRVNVDSTGKCQVINGSLQGYFGANIHTIMADGFFLDYTIGEYSRMYLQQMQDYLRNMVEHKDMLTVEERSRLEDYRKVVPYIGDDIIRNGFEILLEVLS